MLLLTMLQFGVDEFRAFDSANFTLLGTLYPPVEMIRLGNLQIPSNYNGEEQNKEDQQHPSSFFVLIGNYRVSQIGINAVESMFFMGLAYLILMVPILISFTLAVLWRQAFYSPESVVDCSFCIQGFYYTSGILLNLHSSIVNPVLFWFLSSDLLSLFIARISW